jgi:hypothetical protein
MHETRGVGCLEGCFPSFALFAFINDCWSTGIAQGVIRVTFIEWILFGKRRQRNAAMWQRKQRRTRDPAVCGRGRSRSVSPLS